MRLSIGNVADGKNYFERPYLNEKFWRLLENSNHLSIAAPRRVGKTSLMTDIAEKQKEGYKVVYMITESVNNRNEFFRKVYKELLNILSNSRKLSEQIKVIYSRLEIKKISATGMEFGKSEIDFFEEIKDLLKKVTEKDSHIVLMVDEFSQTLENIINGNGKDDAKIFLHQCRELRIDHSCKGKISFVYTGSVGLENLVASIDESKSISDIGRFEMPTLTQEEAHKLIEQILNNEGYVFEVEEQSYLVEKTKWLLPYFIQIIMSSIEEICIRKNTKTITKPIIDAAFVKCLDNRSYFEHWVSRLRIMFKGSQYSCIKEMLNLTAIQNFQSKYDYYDIATKFEVEDVGILIRMLEHDGYVTKHIAEDKYRFNSPLLQEWWLRNIVN